MFTIIPVRQCNPTRLPDVEVPSDPNHSSLNRFQRETKVPIETKPLMWGPTAQELQKGNRALEKPAKRTRNVGLYQGAVAIACYRKARRGATMIQHVIQRVYGIGFRPRAVSLMLLMLKGMPPIFSAIFPPHPGRRGGTRRREGSAREV